MKIKQIYKTIQAVEIGEVFQYQGDIYIKTNASHEKAGYQCVELNRGNLSYIENDEKVTEVNAQLQVFTQAPE